MDWKMSEWLKQDDSFSHCACYFLITTAMVTFFFLCWHSCLMISDHQALISQCLRPPCRGLHSGWWAGCPRPIDQRHRGLCIKAVCRAADAICTFVNYLHSAPQIWSIVNWASGSFWREKTCAGPGDGIVWRLQSYFPLIILHTTAWFPFHWFKYKRKCPGRLSKLSHASQLHPLSAVINAKLQHFKGE